MKPAAKSEANMEGNFGGEKCRTYNISFLQNLRDGDFSKDVAHMNGYHEMWGSGSTPICNTKKDSLVFLLI